MKHAVLVMEGVSVALGWTVVLEEDRPCRWYVDCFILVPSSQKRGVRSLVSSNYVGLPSMKLAQVAVRVVVLPLTVYRVENVNGEEEFYLLATR